MGYKRLNLAERKLIEQYVKEDFSFYRMAELLNRSEHCLYNEVISRNGGRECYNALEADAKSSLQTIGLDGLPVKKRCTHLNLIEREFLEEQLKKDVAISKISFLMGRSLSTIAAEIRKGGGRENYSAQLSHKKYTDNAAVRNGNISKGMKERHDKLGDSQSEITSLKMQIDILFDMIKELRGGKK